MTATPTPDQNQLARAIAQRDYLRTAIELMEKHPSYAPVIVRSALSYLRTMSALEARPC